MRAIRAGFLWAAGQKHRQYTPRIAASAALAAALAACGGGSDSSSPPDPLQPYREQAVQWTECDPTIVGVRSAKLDELWALAGERLRCAMVRAPLDWAHPERGDVFISVMRLAAASPDKRRGALLFNPGGPGIDGLKQTFTLLKAFAQSNPDSPQGAMQLRLLGEYDSVGLSPRGTGASTRLQCATNELMRPIDTSAAHWDTPANLANAEYNGRKQAQACLKNPITPFINTDATARDMDLLRSLLGEKKLNYVGYSYGTWLGAWYAGLFPEKVGRMVLDSAVDFSGTLEQGVFGGQPSARQYLLDHLLVPYAARHADTFHLGATTDEVLALVTGLEPKVQQLLVARLTNLGYGPDDADQYLGTISAAHGLNILLKDTPQPINPDTAANALKHYVFDPANAERDANIRQQAQELLYAYTNTWLRPQPGNVELDTSQSVLTAIHCNDTPAITDPTAWAGWIRSLAQRAPLFAPGNIPFHACAFWGGPKVQKPGLEPLKPLELLFLQSQYDTATHTPGADHFFSQLPAARRIYVQASYKHGLYPYGDSCVDPAVTSYLLGESPTQRETVCQGHPLALDMPPQRRAPAVPTYRNPQQAHKLIDEFKRGLLPSKLKP
ncbi:alpha/beta fold hydrolase [Comamonas resistens]|uniref:Alpha/beta fold hydrolase n=1 Tax=Comamonas resistens TaxID=3046670 RepID=A0ABY8SWC2_9BURK|nr:alpha/beta fold hydrolase [Comamonas resistens]MDL5036102.1 alpha/beta fold hydrolase [Comamonas resistens]WHS66199.1 alpha/beta fold hydrolase [Comamonas resistens]